MQNKLIILASFGASYIIADSFGCLNDMRHRFLDESIADGADDDGNENR